MRRILRFYGFQRIVATMIGGGLMWLAVRLLGSTPPAYWEEWPPQASLALSNLVAGSLGAAFCGWVYMLVRPLLSRPGALGILSRCGFGLTLLSGIGGVWQCLVGGYYLQLGEPGCVQPIFEEWLRVVGWPLLVGLAPLLLLEAYQQIEVNPHLRRWLRSGRGHAASWIRTPELRRFVKPFRKTSAGITEET